MATNKSAIVVRKQRNMLEMHFAWCVYLIEEGQKDKLLSRHSTKRGAVSDQKLMIDYYSAMGYRF